MNKPMMDLKSAFGMHTLPFTREIELEAMFPFSNHVDVADGIVRAVERRMSAALIAAPGTGKTTLVRGVMARLPEARYRVHTVKCTSLSKRDMCREVARTCGLGATGIYPELVRKLQARFEASLYEEGLRPVLVLDEGHDLRPDVLAMLRVLTNFQMDSRLVLSVVLIGQLELATMLKRDDQEAIARRIVYYATLRPLSREESHKYVEHRISVAGARTCPFDPRALDAIYEVGRGNLRTTDNVALEALECAARTGLKVAGVEHVMEARKVLWP
jgi:general secretion pathway protein A